jgi:hypothetical protein
MKKLLLICVLITVLLVGCSERSNDVYKITCYQLGEVVFEDYVVKYTKTGQHGIYYTDLAGKGGTVTIEECSIENTSNYVKEKYMATFGKYRIIKTSRGYMAQKQYFFGWRNAFQRLSEEPVYFDSAEEAEQKLISCGAFEDQETKVVKEF